MSLDAGASNIFAEPKISVERGPDDLAPRAVRSVSIPSVLLGKVLDSDDAGHAIKLLGIKKLYGSGFVLNERSCRKHFNMSRWAFQAGMRLLKARGALVREQRGRGFAKEEPLDRGNGRYVLIDKKLLTKRSALIGFIAAVNLPRDPIRPHEAAARIGITSRSTIRKLVAEALAAGAIGKGARDRSTILVGRKSQEFDLVKNRPAKFQPAKNHPTHRGMEEGHSIMQDRTLYSVNRLSHGTHLRAGNALKKDFEDEEVQDFSRDPDWIALKDWRSGEWFAEREMHATDPPKFSDYPTIGQWEEWLTHFSSDVPGHILRPEAHRQAVEIAHEIEAHWAANYLIAKADAFHALAVWVARACEEGRSIRSFGFIAERLLRQLDDEDTSSVENRPAWYDDQDMAEAASLANQMLDELSETEIDVCRERLVSTSGLEELLAMIRQYGTGPILEGLRCSIERDHRPGDGKRWFGWRWLNDDIANKPKRRTRKAA